MRCERCGRDFAAGLGKCPHCGAAAHYGGNTEFYGKVVSSRLTVADLFTDVFKKHPRGAGARMFMAGTPLSTPTPDRMLSEWQKPWLFARVLGVGLVFALICYWLGTHGLTATIYSLFTLCALITPLSILIFFWEANIPRDIPLYTVLFITLIGGIISIAAVLFLPSLPGGSEMAAFTEEPAKVLAVAVFVYLLDPKYIFGGLLIGASVGTGFTCMENIYYIMGISEDPLGTLLVRSVLALGSHIMWAAMEGGALVMAKKGEKLKAEHFLNPQFLGACAFSIALHYINNHREIQLGRVPFFGDLKYVLVTVAAMFGGFLLLKKAVAQVLAAADGAQFIRHPEGQRFEAGRAAGRAVLSAVSGPLAGADFPFERSVTIGCDPGRCNVVLPPGTPGVSRRHCTLELRTEGVYLMDHSSTYGTFWQSGQRITPNQWVAVTGPFYLGSQTVAFTCR